MRKELLERFTSYVKIDTQPDASSDSTPSTKRQWKLANKLVEELKQIGMVNVTIDEHAYVMATLPANTDKDVPTIGFLAHMDTATDFTGSGVNPQVVESYGGGVISLTGAVYI
ncbi:tripeptide aminopeptidase [Halobacillus karajensis]|nr:tripeptide aminopeptidase [Halobacillus karajensis]